MQQQPIFIDQDTPVRRVSKPIYLILRIPFPCYGSKCSSGVVDQSVLSPYPESFIAVALQADNAVLERRWPFMCKDPEVQTIETGQTTHRAYPKKAVLRLRNCRDETLGQALIGRPSSQHFVPQLQLELPRTK